MKCRTGQPSKGVSLSVFRLLFGLPLNILNKTSTEHDVSVPVVASSRGQFLRHPRDCQMTEHTRLSEVLHLRYQIQRSTLKKVDYISSGWSVTESQLQSLDL